MTWVVPTIRGGNSGRPVGVTSGTVGAAGPGMPALPPPPPPPPPPMTCTVLGIWLRRSGRPVGVTMISSRFVTWPQAGDTLITVLTSRIALKATERECPPMDTPIRELPTFLVFRACTRSFPVSPDAPDGPPFRGGGHQTATTPV